MCSDISKGKWKETKGTIKHRWSKLTDDDIEMIEGDAEKLTGMIQEHYGYDKDAAKKKVEEFLGSF